MGKGAAEAMRKRTRYLGQSACLVIGTGVTLLLILSGLRGAWFVVALAITATIVYTAMDAFDPSSGIRDAAWLRRRVTSNLIYISGFSRLSG